MSQSRPVAIVTGGARGIGAACAEMFATRGFNVLLSYVNSQTAADDVVKTCRDHGSDADSIQSDISVDKDCISAVKYAMDRWSRIDVLVNNAGITRFADPSDLASLSAKDFEDIFSVNVTGTYQMSRAVTSYIDRSPIASIVNISSHSGFSGIGSSMAYAASKGALNTLTLSLARALAPKIRVNAVCPGFVDTDWMKSNMDDQELREFKQNVSSAAPLKRLVSPQEIAEAVSWFALGGKSITGQLLVVDGGTHLAVSDPL
jgi:3-oxoacyl-[acyl-carrier protein] reductase